MSSRYFLRHPPVLSRCLAALLLFGFSTFSFAQTPIETISVSVADGLASPQVHHVMQDSYGLIWVSTANGLQMFDGYAFQTFKNDDTNKHSIANNVVWHVTEDRDRNLWVSHGDGVSKFDRKTSSFKNYYFGLIFNYPVPTGVIVFRTFLDSQGRLFAATRNMEVVQYDPASDKWKCVPYDVKGLDPESIHSGITLGVTEDSKGGIWASTSAYGLMYMPKGASALKQVAPEKLEPFSFVGDVNTITALFSDKNDVLWITSRFGVYKFNPQTEVMTVLRTYPEVPDIANYLNCIRRDPEGNIWITNNYHGILKFKQETDEFEDLYIAGKLIMKDHGWNTTITGQIIDRSGIFWFSTMESGLLKYDPVNKPFSVFTHDEKNPLSLSANGVFGALASQVHPGIVYVGTRGHGLNIYDPSKRSFSKVTFKVQDDRFGGSVRGIGEDSDGSLWLGSWGDGLIKLDKNYKETARYKYDPDESTSISSNLVRVIRPDGKGKLWVGTDNGLNVFDAASGKFDRITSTVGRVYPEALFSLVDGLLKSEALVKVIDHASNLVDIKEPFEIKESGTFLVVASGETDQTSVADHGWIENAAQDTIWKFPAFKESRHAGGALKNRVFISTIDLQPGAYVLRYRTDDSHAYGNWNDLPPDMIDLYGIAVVKLASEDQKKSVHELVVPDDKDVVIGGSNILDILVTKKYVWVSVEGAGISRIDRATPTVQHFTYDFQDPKSLSSNIVQDIFEDSHGVIWMATEQGICKFDDASQTFVRYLEKDGLPTNLTTCILEGDNGEMWIATQNGIAQMVSNERLGKITFINYNITDGLGGDVFLQLTSAKGSDGSYYFGGDHGLTTFKSIKANKTPPNLIFSDLLISNQSVFDPEVQSLLPGSILDAKEIVLPFDKNNLSFEFAALHYANPKKNQYAHMLKGYDKDWIYDNRTFASYTNLDPGEYEMMIRGSNAYGIWNEEGTSIKISILPPWWKTWWAYLSYVLIFGLVIYVGDRAIRRNIKQRERERSREKELKQAREIEKAYAHLKETQAQLVQSEKMASLGELTAGIAHEIQNPLNFVNNFSEINKELIDEMNQEIAAGNFDDAKEIARNIADNEAKINFHGKRADAIVKGMLQHSRSSSGIKEPTDVNAIADEYLRLAYHGLRAKDKTFNASMKTEFDPAVGKVNVVPQDIGRVILNLITNAFYVVAEKKAKLNGESVSGVTYDPLVTVSTRNKTDGIEIRVTDNGSGIPQSVLDKIFQPFFTTKPSGQGTGLGLSMSYEIVTKGHGGELKVETKVGEGTTFIVSLPN